MKRRLLSLIFACIISIGLVQVFAQQAPVITCPSNLIFNLSPGKCDTAIAYIVTATGNPTPVISQVTGLASGSAFPLGVTALKFIASNSEGSDSCQFTITINEYQPPTEAIVCEDAIHISLPSSCTGFLWPDNVLEGDYGCHDKFNITINNTGTNIVDSSMLNTYIMYTITHKETGNSCMGLGLVQDKLAPVFTNCDTIRIHSFNNPRPVSEGGQVPLPTIAECSQYSLSYQDVIVQGACNDTFALQILRKWTAKDANGHTSFCVQVIVVKRLSLSFLTPLCPAPVQVECKPGKAPILTPDSTGYPRVIIDGVTFNVPLGSNSTCRLGSSYSDDTIRMCGSSFKIIRKWKVLDCCLDASPGFNPWTCVQIIDYNDTTPPVIPPLQDLTFSVEPGMCTARPVIPAFNIVDCSDVVVEMKTSAGVFFSYGGQMPLPSIDTGEHTIIVTAIDKCGNSSSSSFKIKVIDTQIPVAACKANIVVALNAQGYGVAPNSTFNLGSNDNCCLGDMKVRRMSDNCGNPNALLFRDFVEFCCNDVGKPVTVVLRVYDCHGNFNECMAVVEVQDQTAPVITTCLPPITITCTQGLTNQNITGRIVFSPAVPGPNDGLVTDNCPGQLTLTSRDSGSLNCGKGTILRTFQVVDPAGRVASCVQTITVVPGASYVNADFQFPKDTIVGSCGPGALPAVTGNPVLPAAGICNYFVVAYKDSIRSNPPLGVCQQILRRWVIVDTCQYDPNVVNSPGRWEHIQTITIIDQTPPVVSDCLPRKFCAFKDDCGFISPNLSISATDNCTPANQLTYSWVVDLYNDGIADVGSIYAGTGQNNTNFYDYGTHKITYRVSDGCGNTATCSFLFTIEDCKKPTVVCRPSVTVQLGVGGTTSVNVKLLESGASSDNCTPRDKLRFSYTPTVTDTIRTFNCLQKGSNPVLVWATDLTNNKDSCKTTIIVEDTQNPCVGGMIAFSGKVTTEQNTGVKNVTMQLNGSMVGMAYTNSQGEFHFGSLPVGNDYSFTPELNDHPLNGVSTYDMVLLQRHILGIQLLDSPYKIIAGDVNKNNMLTTSDLVDLRRVILHILPQFPGNKPWRFVDAQQVFSDPRNPFANTIKEIHNVNNLSLSSPKPSFVAIKVGDVNGSSLGANLLSGVDGRSAGSDLLLRTEERYFMAGETFTVDFSSNVGGLLAYQFTLNFNKDLAEVVEVNPGFKAGHSNFSMALANEGAITASWGQMEANREADEVLFQLKLQAKRAGKLSDLLYLNSRYTTAEAYDKDGKSRGIQLQFANGINSIGRFELMQNVPNPFTERTTIGFELPEQSVATLSLFDISGRKLKEFKGEYSAGYHEVVVDKNSLPNSGVLYYRLETPTNTITKKMTFLR